MSRGRKKNIVFQVCSWENLGSEQNGFLDARIPVGRKRLPTYSPSSSSALGWAQTKNLPPTPLPQLGLLLPGTEDETVGFSLNHTPLVVNPGHPAPSTRTVNRGEECEAQGSLEDLAGGGAEMVRGGGWGSFSLGERKGKGEGE